MDLIVHAASRMRPLVCAVVALAGLLLFLAPWANVEWGGQPYASQTGLGAIRGVEQWNQEWSPRQADRSGPGDLTDASDAAEGAASFEDWVERPGTAFLAQAGGQTTVFLIHQGVSIALLVGLALSLLAGVGLFGLSGSGAVVRRILVRVLRSGGLLAAIGATFLLVAGTPLQSTYGPLDAEAMFAVSIEPTIALWLTGLAAWGTLGSSFWTRMPPLRFEPAHASTLAVDGSE